MKRLQPPLPWQAPTPPTQVREQAMALLAEAQRIEAAAGTPARPETLAKAAAKRQQAVRILRAA